MKVLDNSKVARISVDTTDEFLTQQIAADDPALDKKSKEMLLDYDYNLSAKGKQAIDAIVSVIRSQLNGKSAVGDCS